MRLPFREQDANIKEKNPRTKAELDLRREARESREHENESLREWRSRWCEIMLTSVIYFDEVALDQVDKLRPYISVVHAKIQPFYDNNVTHVVGNNPHGEMAMKAKATNAKFYSVDKMHRFLCAILGISATRTLEPAQSARLAEMLEADSRNVYHTQAIASKKENFHFFKGTYVMVWDPSQTYRPLCMKEYGPPSSEDWPLLSKLPIGICPFLPRKYVKPLKKRSQPRDGEATGGEKTSNAAGETAASRKNAYNSKRRKTADSEEANKENPDTHMHKSTNRNALSQLSLNRKDTRANNFAIKKVSVDSGCSHKLEIPCTPAKQPLHTHIDAENKVATQSNENGLLQNQPQNQSQNDLGATQQSAKITGEQMPMRPAAAQPAQAAPSIRLRDFGEIAASGVQRYSQTSTKSYLPIGGETAPSREISNLKRKVMPGPQIQPLKPKSTVRTNKANKKPGFCENCLEKYNDVQEHLASANHLKFAENNRKFVQLDELISQLHCRNMQSQESDMTP